MLLILCVDPLCRHVFEECEAVTDAREKTGIAAFLTSCEATSTSAAAYFLFVSGKDASASEVPFKVFLSRGAALLALQSSWTRLLDS